MCLLLNSNISKGDCLFLFARNTLQQTTFVAVRYRVYNEDKSQVLKESPDTGAEFVLKEGVAVPALPIALKTMKKGEKASLVLKAGCEFC